MDAHLFNTNTKLVDYRNDAWRVVESQEEKATLNIVDSIEEQELLEAMLDSVKPAYREGTQGMHYLLKTAFRYPPLKYGSRFGSQLMPSYFYGSESFETALCETAYYRFMFLQHMGVPYQAPIRSEYSLFKVTVASESCLNLASRTYKGISPQLTNPQSYTYTQQIGEWAREQQPPAEIIRFYSARKTNAVNLAIAEPKAIRSRQPRELRQWLCLTKWNETKPQDSSVSFRSRESKEIYEFRLSDFSNKSGQFLQVS